jgi:hypothetical protein
MKASKMYNFLIGIGTFGRITFLGAKYYYREWNLFTVIPNPEGEGSRAGISGSLRI